MAPSNTVPRKSRSSAEQKQAFERLCAWIETHLDEPIGWQEMMGESGLDFQTINVLAGGQVVRAGCAAAHAGAQG